MRNKRNGKINFIVGIAIISIIFVMMAVSFFYTPYDTSEMDIANKLSPPSSEHWFGTDNFGRDIFSRIMKGSQTAFLVGTITVSIGMLFGVLIGSIAGFTGGIVDEILMRIMDAFMSFPGILLALMFVAIWGVGIVNTMIALGILLIPRFARITRGGFLQVKEMLYVKMAQSIGVPDIRIMFVHILPNVISPIIVTASIAFASAVLAEAGLSYLGLGVQPPDPSWGRMLSESQLYLLKAPFFSIAPGVMITMIVLGFNMLGDSLRDMNDPRKR